MGGFPSGEIFSDTGRIPDDEAAGKAKNINSIEWLILTKPQTLIS